MFSFVYITTSTIEEAKNIGKQLISEHLAACVNIFPITSIFRWKDSIDEASEFGIIIKTKSEKVKDIEKKVKELHSYEVPCVVSFKLDESSPEFLKWIKESVEN